MTLAPTTSPYRRRCSRIRRLAAGLGSAIVILTGPRVAAMAEGDVDFPPATLAIRTALGEVHAFQGELADTGPRRRRGLMFRRELAEDYAMLFDFKRPHRITMWMRNTYVSLDMLFVDEDGIVRHVVADTTPLSESTIEPPVPVLAVIEVPAGTAARRCVGAGDEVLHPMFPEPWTPTGADLFAPLPWLSDASAACRTFCQPRDAGN